MYFSHNSQWSLTEFVSEACLKLVRVLISSHFLLFINLLIFGIPRIPRDSRYKKVVKKYSEEKMQASSQTTKLDSLRFNLNIALQTFVFYTPLSS